MPLCLVELKKGVRTAVLGHPVADEHLTVVQVLFCWRTLHSGCAQLLRSRPAHRAE